MEIPKAWFVKLGTGRWVITESAAFKDAYARTGPPGQTVVLELVTRPVAPHKSLKRKLQERSHESHRGHRR